MVSSSLHRVVMAAVGVSAAGLALVSCNSLVPEGSLQVTVKIAGQGTVTSSPTGIFCRASAPETGCQATFTSSQLPVDLHATPAKAWLTHGFEQEGGTLHFHGVTKIRREASLDNRRETWLVTFEEDPNPQPEPEPEPMDAGSAGGGSAGGGSGGDAGSDGGGSAGGGSAGGGSAGGGSGGGSGGGNGGGGG